ncbi:MAG: nucleotidyl transferase AbiEii/AbiGii toxin family protein [Nitrospira sp.]|nr:nucleotidyl transferase AbiEii/AbiGii toxin family protein [Nitrospira sp.]MBH0183651.1 nucleotidyl transferase AbiEii/AbiGii toxin family protein [Nitrospira sp.]MBH0186185.1 nucleotidyl transferase AbiEii/AbiGii toxin family protein [Nitrospira sp.]
MPDSILTPLQHRTLTSFFQNGLGERGFYLTGGTALAEFYLHHRYSDDLDFFTRKQGPLEKDFQHILDFIPLLDLTIQSKNPKSSEHLVVFVEANGSHDSLKVEFARDVPARMAQPTVREGVTVDSFEDIATNKICAILSRQPSEPKDFYDLYFILKESQFTLDHLISRAREKEALLDSEEGVLIFAANLLTVQNLPLMRELEPRMVKQTSAEQLKDFLLPLATKLSQRYRPPSK